LMEVIDKIGNIEMPTDTYKDGDRVFVEQVYPRTFGMKDEDGNYMFRFNGFRMFAGKTIIECAYIAAVDFVEFHNKKKK